MTDSHVNYLSYQLEIEFVYMIIQLERQRATVVEEVAPRSYNLKTDDGVTYRRNRADIKRFDSTPTTTTDIEISPDGSGRKEFQQEDSTVSIQDQNQAESKEQLVLPRRGERIRVPRKRLIESM